MPNGAGSSSRHLLSALAIASGWCGIAYELLYSRLLTTYLGDMFHVNAAILTSFLLGIGLGSAIAHRFTRWLWLIELLIGAYAFLVAGGLFVVETRLLQEGLSLLGGSRLAVIGATFALTLFPASMIGFSVPLFAYYAQAHGRGSGPGASFRRVYWLYNLGAGLCVLSMEYGLLRWWGIRASLLCLASLNAASGCLLFRFRPELSSTSAPPPPSGILGAEEMALFGVGVLSGLYQLFLLKLTEILFGPFHENFALVLAWSLSGIALSSLLIQRLKITFHSLLLLGSALIASVFICFGPLIYTWAVLNGAVGGTWALSRVLKIAMLGLLGGGPILIFGATIPALVTRASSETRSSGRLLSISSFGNCAGYLLAVFLVYERMSYAALALLFPTGLWIAALVARRARGVRTPAWAVPSLALSLLVLAAWPGSLLRLSYREYISLEVLNRAIAGIAGFEELRRFDENVKLIRTSSGETEVVINGYRSLVSSHAHRTNLKELIVGIAPALYAKKHQRALVLGVGTGITAGATASMFRKTTGIEINPAVIAALPRFQDHNLNLLARPEFELVLDDGLSFLARTREKYDAIVSTVTSPLYFSSSKLYTREFLELAKSRLAPGGVYAMWFDSRVTAEGAKIIFRTVQQSFSDCHLVYLSAVYSELICGTGELSPRDIPAEAWSPELLAKIGSERLDLTPNQLLRALIFPKHRILSSTWEAPVNTFDRPQLEFLMASVSLSEVDPKKAWTPYRLAMADLEQSAAADRALTADELLSRCLVFRAVGGVEYPDCASRIGAFRGRLPLSYLRHLAVLLEENDSVGALLPIAEQLGAQERIDEALVLLQRNAGKLGGRGDFQEILSRLHFEKDHALDDKELSNLYRIAPLNPNVRRLLARVCAQRGQTKEAIAHLAVLKQLGGSRPADRDFAAVLARRFPPGGSSSQ